MATTYQYIDPAELEKELILFCKSGKVSENLGQMFLDIANNLSKRKNFINYTFKEDMIGRGLFFLCKYAKSFDKDAPNCNAFAYCSLICSRGFVQCIKEESKHSLIKDSLIKKSMEKSEMDKYMEDHFDDSSYD